MLTVFSFQRPNGQKNFGDDVSLELISRILKLPAVWEKQHKADINGIGSNLQSMTTVKMRRRFFLRKIFGKRQYIWGSGNISNYKISLPHDNILALRGPLTHETIVNIPHNKFTTYGDPGILFSRYWPKISPATFDIGLVLHYKDSRLSHNIKELYPEIKIIRADQDPSVVLHEITTCKTIMSSSLHGLIAADSSKIPNMKVEFDQPLKGGTFKFEDYALGVGRPIYKTHKILNLPDIRALIKNRIELCTTINNSALTAACDRLENRLKEAFL